MKKSTYAGILFLMGSAIICNGNLMAQKSTKKSTTMENAKTWFEGREWAEGLKLKAHPSVNVNEFSDQYHKNRNYWKTAFNYLKNTDLDTVTPGRYDIDVNNVYIIVTDGKTKAFEDAKWENHRKYIDIQYVVRGKEKMGIAPLSKAKVTEAYDEARDIAFNSVAEQDSKYYIAEPGTFLIFFPQDAHRPAIKVEGYETVRKVVIKIRAAQ